MARSAYVNRIATAVPPHEVHGKFRRFAPQLIADPRARRLFERMAERSGIERRHSVLEPHADDRELEAGGRFPRGAFPATKARMALWEDHAPALAAAAVERLALGPDERPTHIIVTTCTGFHAPGIDIDLMQRLGLPGDVERTVIGFMGCYAAINGLKTAHHIVRSEPQAQVLLVNIELCTLHMQETDDLEALLSFLLFADGCAASLITGRPQGLEITGFHAAVVPDSDSHITWRIGDGGFDMVLSGEVPTVIGRGLPAVMDDLRRRFPQEVRLWAVHPGGRSVLDAVERGLDLPAEALAASRAVLRDYGNMSSPTVMFVLQRLMAQAEADAEAEGREDAADGLAMAFGPGLTAECMAFRTVPAHG